MTISPVPSETLHASCVAKDGRAILISGRSGSGKSDLALRLIDRGAMLVSDDYTIVRRVGSKLLASAPETISGKLEVRGLGILEFEPAPDTPVCLLADVRQEIERMPDAAESTSIVGMPVPVVAIAALEASAPVKVEIALARFGLAPA